MPTIRYQIRNEYGLADPELHQAADRDDPEAILEGVAMAGLVGVLRQLGDLAEFAAEIFRDLHEEVMGTAARGHGLMLRVQQLEAEFPSVEKAILSLSSHSNFAYNDGIDWHSNIQMDQNLITQGDMPRFILDSYEECRGPPRLFTLDKFDTAGAGACLKRYSDPSFFKMELASSGLLETEVPREKKSRKIRKKGSRWKNGPTLESLLSPRANSDLKPTSDQVSGNSATRLVRLKTRNLNDTNGSNGGSIRKRLLEMHSDEQKVVFDNSRSHSNIIVKSVNSRELTSVTHDTVVDMSANRPFIRDVSPTLIPNKEVTSFTKEVDHHQKIKSEEFSEALHEPFVVEQNPRRDLNFVESKGKFAGSENKSEGIGYDYELSNPDKTTSVQVVDHKLAGVTHKLEGSTDGYRTEDIGSEQENFMDALNIMESEVETDYENKDRHDLGIPRKEDHEISFDSERLEELLTEISEQDSAEVPAVSVGLNHLLDSGISSNLSNLDEARETQGEVIASSPFSTKFFIGETHDESCEELLPHDDVTNPTDLMSNGDCSMMTFDNPSLGSEIRGESFNSCVISSTSNPINVDPQESSGALRSVTAYYNDASAGHEVQQGEDEMVKCFDGLPHLNKSFPEMSHPAEDVEDLILENMTEMLEMPNNLSCLPTRSASMEDPDDEDSLSMTVPTVKEMQDSMDQEAKAIALENDSISSGRSILTTIPDFVHDISMDVVQRDELAADITNAEEFTMETSSDYMNGTGGIADNVNGSSVGTKDDSVSENLHLVGNPIELISEEMAFRPDLPDHLSETKHESSLVEVFAEYIEVPPYPSNATIKKSPQLNDDAEVCSSQTILPPDPAIAIISDKDCSAVIENIVAAENLEVVFDNSDNMEISNLAMPEILQPQLEFFSDTEEPQESPKVNSAKEPQESPKVNSDGELLESLKVDLAVEPQQSLDVDFAEKPQEYPEVNSAEKPQEYPEVNLKEGPQEYPKVDSSEEPQESPEVNSSEEPQDSPEVNLAAEPQEAPEVNLAAESQESPEANSAVQVPLCSDSETFADSVMNSLMLVGDNLSSSNEFFQDNTQKNVQQFEQIIDVKNLSAENFASEAETNNYDAPLVYTEEASRLQLWLPEDSTPVAAVSYQHQLKNRETCSPNMVEALDSQGTPNMAVSSGVEQPAFDPTASYSGFPVTDSSNANDCRLLGDICNTMPDRHVQEFLRPRVDDTYLEYPVESEQDFGSKCLGQGYHESAKQEMSLLTDTFSDPASVPEEASSLEASDEAKVDLESLHQKGEYLELDIPTHSICVDDKPSEGPEPNYYVSMSNVKYEEFNMLQSNTDKTEKLDSEALVSSECSSEIIARHMDFSVSDMTFSDLSSSGVGVTESTSRLSYEPQSDEPTSCIPTQNSEEPPPLPPLPPLEWRTRKLQLSSLLPNVYSSQLLDGTNPFMAPADGKPENPFMAPPFGLSELPPIAIDQSHQPDTLSLEGSIVHSSSASLLVSSSLEYEKSLYAPDAEEGSKLPLADSFKPFPILESQTSQHSTLQEERIQPLPETIFQISELWPVSELENSHYSEDSHLNLEQEMIEPQNQFLVESTSEHKNHHHSYGDFESENVHLLKLSELSLSSGSEMSQPGYAYFLEGSQSTLFGVVPTREDEWFSIKPRSIRNRPRNPLIEAVAAHDRSTLRKVTEVTRPSNDSMSDKKDALLESNILQLRKVSELVKPSDKPKADERDALLEQIRNKSFSLKPTVLSKPNNKGHSTNIKVAAILEKANALRQAMVGSDEEDGGGNWSDC